MAAGRAAGSRAGRAGSPRAGRGRAWTRGRGCRGAGLSSWQHVQSCGRVPQRPFGWAQGRGLGLPSIDTLARCVVAIGEAGSARGLLQLAPALRLLRLVDDRPVLSPLLRPAIAQPEDAGAHVGQHLFGVVRRDRLAVVAEHLGDLALHAPGAGEQGGHDRIVGDCPAASYSITEVRDRGDPVVDGRARYPEALGKGGIGGACNAGKARYFRILGLVDRGSAARHDDAPSCSNNEISICKGWSPGMSKGYLLPGVKRVSWHRTTQKLDLECWQCLQDGRSGRLRLALS